MIEFKNRLGKVRIKEEYFEKLIGKTVSSCYGVSQMMPDAFQKVMSVLSKKTHESAGIKVRGEADAITVDVHISVMYGLNIKEISKSIANKIKFSVESSTGMSVKNVRVHIDGMKEA